MNINVLNSVQFSHSVLSDFLWPYGLQNTRLPSPSPAPGVYSNSSPSKFMMWTNHLILSHPLLLLPSNFPSIRVFSRVSSSHQVVKGLELQLQHQSFQRTPRTDLFRMDWLDLLAVQRTLKSRLQHHSSKASVLWHPAFFVVQLSHPYMTTGKTIALTKQTFVDKVMSLLFNMLSRLIITFLPRSKRLLTSWLQSPSAVILDPKKIVSHCFHSFPIYLPWSDGTRCHDLHFLNVEL